MREPETVAQVSRLAVLAEKNCSSNGSVKNESLHAKFDEMSKQLQQLTLSSVNVIQVEKAWGQNQRIFSQSRTIPGRASYPYQSRSDFQCCRCAIECRDRRVCPALNQICRKCSKPGHFQRTCRSGNRKQGFGPIYRTFIGGYKDKRLLSAGDKSSFEIKQIFNFMQNAISSARKSKSTKIAKSEKLQNPSVISLKASLVAFIQNCLKKQICRILK